MNKYDIAFDLDDVIFDTSVQLIDRLKNDGKIPSNFQYEDCLNSNIENIFGPDYIPHSYLVKEVFTDHFFRSLPYYQNIVDDIKILIENGIRICYITSRDVTQYDCSVKALEQAGLRDPDVYICTTSLKAKLAKQFGVKIFVDDRSEVAFSALALGMSAFVPIKPYNYYVAKFGVLVDTWDNLRLQFFQEIKRLGISDEIQQKQEKIDGKWFV